MAPARPGKWTAPPPLKIAYKDLVLDGWHLNPDKVAVIHVISGEEVTYRELEDRVFSFAGSLQSLGVHSGRRVQFYTDNSLNALVAVQALLFCNASVFFFKPYKTVKYGEYKFETVDADAEFIITDATNYDLTVHAFLTDPDCRVKKVIIVEGTPIHDAPEDKVLFAHQLPKGKFIHPSDVRIREDILIVSYTSGSTGLPKGVMHSHYSFVTSLTAMPRARCDPDNDREMRPLMLSTFSYTSGLLDSSATLMCGATLLLANEEILPDLPIYVERYKATSILIFESCMQVLLKNASRFPNRKQMLASLRIVVIAGTVFPAQRREQTKEYFGNVLFKNGYGSTEAIGLISCPPPRPEVPRDVGFIAPYYEVKIINDKGDPVEVGEPGELLWRGPQMMRGYWKRDGSREFTEDGFFRSGDLVAIDAEGNMTIIGRKKLFIICLDERVAPDEIETVLLEHPAVKEAVVVATPHPVVQEAPTGMVVLSPDYEKLEDLNSLRQELINFVKERLSEHKQLHGGIHFVDDLEKTASGKYARMKIAERAFQFTEQMKT